MLGLKAKLIGLLLAFIGVIIIFASVFYAGYAHRGYKCETDTLTATVKEVQNHANVDKDIMHMSPAERKSGLNYWLRD